MKKIVHIITRLVRGGADENTVYTCNLQAKRGHKVWLIHGEAVHPALERLVDDRVTVLAEPDLIRDLSVRRDLRALRGLTETFRKLAPDVVHTHTSKAGVLGRIAANRANVPVILHGVHILPFLNVSWTKEKIYKAMERYTARFTDAFISVSHGMRKANLDAGLGRVDSNFVVPSGMDIDKFRSAQAVSTRPDGNLIVMVAALEARKRHYEFLDVFAELLKTHPKTTLAFSGEGEEMDRLQERAAELAIADNVLFLGFRTDVEQWVAAADLCVLSSSREGLPRVVVQYVASGKPVVVAALPGLEEIVEDGKNGFVTDAVDVGDMLEPIRQILSDDGLAASLSKQSRAWDVAKWSMDRMEQQIEEIMQDIFSNKFGEEPSADVASSVDFAAAVSQ